MAEDKKSSDDKVNEQLVDDASSDEESVDLELKITEDEK